MNTVRKGVDAQIGTHFLVCRSKHIFEMTVDVDKISINPYAKAGLLSLGGAKTLLAGKQKPVCSMFAIV